MPNTISKGTETSTFAYGPDHQRTKQTKQDGSIIYYAGAMEVETKAGVVQSLKTYWPNGLGVEIDKPSQATDLNWTHQDRIGSIIAISDRNGNIAEKLAYDSWGKRRALAGADDISNSIDGVKDNKGFTGHEMLDKLDLVHMNGRIYDPFVARFMSADPFIQDPEHSQSYNRYTYVWNNPTNLTDPTGFVAMSDAAADAAAEAAAAESTKVKVKRFVGLCEQKTGCIGTLYANGTFVPAEQKQNQGADKTGTGNVTLGKGVPLVPRDNWAQYPADPNKMTDSNGQFTIISLHHTGSQNTPEDVETLHRWKISTSEKLGREMFGQTYKGQGDVSYHFLIDANGVVYEGRSLEYKCACVSSYNNKNIGIAFLGDYSQSKLNDKQMNAAVTLIDYLNVNYGDHSKNALYGSLTIFTHADFDSKKQSELKGAQAQVKQIKSLAKEHWTRD
jgi:RHS repeat-associated protein